MINETIDRTVRELRNEADIDFIDLPFIAGSLREDLDLKTQEDIRRHTLDVIRRLMERGVYPGDYDHAIHMAFWPGEPSEHLRRIEAEWIAMGQPPPCPILSAGSASSQNSRRQNSIVHEFAKHPLLDPFPA